MVDVRFVGSNAADEGRRRIQTNRADHTPHERVRYIMSNLEEILKLATPINLQLRWSDQDPNRHVNNASIGTLFEEARIRARSVWNADASPNTDEKVLVRAQNTTFDREVHYTADTTIWVWISRIGRTSHVVSHLLIQDEVPCVHMEVTVVTIDANTGKPKVPKEEYRQQLEAHSGPGYSA